MAGKTEYKNKWQSENCDRVNLTIKKGQKAVVEDVAKSQGESVNGYVKKAVGDRIKADTGKDIDL